MVDTLTPRSEQKRQQIVASASALFMQQGYVTTSMDEIAQHAGVSKQTVYAHFGSKDELFTYCIQSKCVGAELVPEAMLGEDIRAELMAFADRFTQMVHSEEAVYVYRLCVSQAETHPELSRRYFEAGPDRVRGILSEYLARVAAAGKLVVPDARLAAEQLLLMARGMEHLSCELGLPCEESDSQRHARLSSCIDLFLRGYQFQQ
ncbi:TetR/AcrR family transcriptional regulator [Ferrimonas marina]|uniref:Transcriptional regulator, TetR family n=1 Tax=Ferrimonas marina TaxID=299255 RepID=A0A1M5RQ31_9GAMM|nr:TetR/AcrR family transcriptional regulator [Ferrimonas marina]SHH28415.1 transcriptional regulator, TetR family [Ferrimonas marina]